MPEQVPDSNYVMMQMWSIMAFVHTLKAGPVSEEDVAAQVRDTQEKVRAVWNELVADKSKRADLAGSVQLCKECLQYCVRVLEA